jgi:hypothetical protein
VNNIGTLINSFIYWISDSYKKSVVDNAQYQFSALSQALPQNMMLVTKGVKNHQDSEANFAAQCLLKRQLHGTN